MLSLKLHILTHLTNNSLVSFRTSKSHNQSVYLCPKNTTFNVIEPAVKSQKHVVAHSLSAMSRLHYKNTNVISGISFCLSHINSGVSIKHRAARNIVKALP